MVFSNSQLSGHMWLFFEAAKNYCIVFDTELKYPIQCTEAD